MRIASVTALLVVVAACHGGPGANHGGGDGHPTPHGTCGASSVVTTLACPKRTIPKSNESSAAGCKSDADCTNGIEGRCVKSGFAQPPSHGGLVRSSLLAEAPAPPPPTICEYDQCTTNADCGAKGRCQCGEGTSRNGCLGLDACLADQDCGADALCQCGVAGGPNVCLPGNCRNDGDCASGTCQAAQSGSFCTSQGDRCRSRDDCLDAGSGFQVCDYDTAIRAFVCRMVPPVAPG